MESLRNRAIAFLRWSEQYTKTDMVYLFGSGFWNNLNVAIGTISALTLSIAFANMVPKETYGTYQYLLSLASLLGALTLTGMNNAVAQAVARGHDGILASAVKMQLRWGSIPFLAGIVTGIYYYANGNHPLGTGLCVIAIAVPLTNAWNTYGAYLNGHGRYRDMFIANTVTTLLYTATMLFALIFVKDALTLLIANVGLLAIITGVIYISVSRRVAADASTEPGALDFGKHLSLTNMFATLAAQLDNLLVFHFLGAAPLAVYNFACAIPERIGGLFKFLALSGVQRFSTRSQDELRQGLPGKTWRSMLAGLIVAGVYAAAAPYLFALFFPTYMDAVPYSQLYAIMIALTAGSLPATALIAQQMRREIYILRTVGPAANAVLQIVLLLSFGLTGLLIGRLISSGFDILLALWLFLKRSEASQEIDRK